MINTNFISCLHSSSSIDSLLKSCMNHAVALNICVEMAMLNWEELNLLVFLQALPRPSNHLDFVPVTT